MVWPRKNYEGVQDEGRTSLRKKGKEEKRWERKWQECSGSQGQQKQVKNETPLGEGEGEGRRETRGGKGRRGFERLACFGLFGFGSAPISCGLPG